VPSGYIPPSGNSSRRASSTHPAGVRPFAWPDIDSDDEEEQMFVEIFCHDPGFYQFLGKIFRFCIA
jgi:hypothetical protein